MSKIASPPCDEAVILARPCERPAVMNGAWIRKPRFECGFYRRRHSACGFPCSVVGPARDARSGKGDVDQDLHYAAVASRGPVGLESYALFLAALLVISGSLGDIYGRRKTADIGVVLFAAASLCYGLSRNIQLAILSRSLQGNRPNAAAPSARGPASHRLLQRSAPCWAAGLPSTVGEVRKGYYRLVAQRSPLFAAGHQFDA
jgi:hypothetical protein